MSDKPSGTAPAPDATPAPAPAGEAEKTFTSIDDILDAEFPPPPDGQTSHKGLPHPKEWDNLTPDQLKKIAYNLREDARKKTTAAAEMTRSRDKMVAEALAEQHARLKQALAVPEGEDIDPYTPEGMIKLIRREAARMLDEQQAPVRGALAKQQRLEEVAAFRQANPDIVEHETRVRQLMANGMMLEDAYFRSKGEKAAEREAALRAELEAARQAAAEKKQRALDGIGIGSAGPGGQRGAKSYNGDIMAAFLDAKREVGGS